MGVLAGVRAGFRPLTRISLLVTGDLDATYGDGGWFQTVDTDFSPGDNRASR